MTASILDLKKRGNRLESLREKAKETNQAGGSKDKDDRFWSPSVDENGNGMAIIRFLPEPPGEDFAWVKLYTKAFQGPTSNKWYIEDCRTTLGENDPVSELASRLWNSGIESDKEVARLIKRRLSYVSNVYVVDDPEKPENNGKVFLYRYGKKIFDMITLAMNPEYKDETAVNPFDVFEGANFRLKIRKVAGYRNYDSSKFDSPSRLAKSDDKIEEIWNKCHPLQPLLDPSKFKSYSELQKQLVRVLGTVVGSGVPVVEGVDTSEDVKPQAKKNPSPARSAQNSDEKEEQVVQEKPKPSAKAESKPAKPVAVTVTSDDDDDLEAFLRQAGAE